jgi:predicted Zn-dependent peptidase
MSRHRNLLSAEGLSAVLTLLALVFSAPPPAEAQERVAPSRESRPRVPVYDAGTPIRRKVLKNGVTLLVQEQRTGERVAGTVTARMGTLYETDAEAGYSLVLTRSMVSGTSKQSPADFKLRLLALNAELESAAGADFGQLAIATRREGASQAASILGEIATSPSFADTSVEAARQEAIRRAGEQTEGAIASTYSMFLKAMFAGSPLERPVSGTVAALSSCRRADLVALHRRFCVGSNLVVVFVGNFDGKRMLADLEKAFAKVPAGPIPEPAGGEPRTIGSDTLLTDSRDFRLRSLVYGYPAPGYGEPDHPAFMILASYLASADRSPIAYWLPTRRQATGVGAIYAPYPKRSSLAIHLGATASQWQGARDSVVVVLKRLTTEPLDEGEWGVQLQRVHSSYFVNQRDPKWRASQMGYLEATGRGHDYPKRFEEQLLRLTPEDVRAAAARWFTHSCEASILPRESE